MVQLVKQVKMLQEKVTVSIPHNILFIAAVIVAQWSQLDTKQVCCSMKSDQCVAISQIALK